MSGGDHLRATGGARAVVFLHGIGAGAEMFAPQIAALGRSCDVIGWNLPGYGGHDLDGEMTFEGLSAALLAFLDRLHLARVDLVGHSIGGMLAQAFVARHPERVRTLVLSATTAAFGSRDGSFQKQFVAERLAPLDAVRRMPELAAEFVPVSSGRGQCRRPPIRRVRQCPGCRGNLSRGDPLSYHLRRARRARPDPGAEFS
ncbi:MAG: alpha/beta fold hydrolase [Alphaproteobacteria bacterium]|nr:alpha/beta fold hydrolase [Alphaproteobacteria bacterium]